MTDRDREVFDVPRGRMAMPRRPPGVEQQIGGGGYACKGCLTCRAVFLSWKPGHPLGIAKAFLHTRHLGLQTRWPSIQRKQGRRSVNRRPCLFLRPLAGAL